MAIDPTDESVMLNWDFSQIESALTAFTEVANSASEAIRLALEGIDIPALPNLDPPELPEPLFPFDRDFAGLRTGVEPRSDQEPAPHCLSPALEIEELNILIRWQREEQLRVQQRVRALTGLRVEDPQYRERIEAIAYQVLRFPAGTAFTLSEFATHMEAYLAAGGRFSPSHSAPKMIVLKGGRPKALGPIDAELVKLMIGKTRPPIFADLCGISVDTLRQALNEGLATDQTLSKICNTAKAQKLKLTPEKLKKNHSQKPE